MKLYNILHIPTGTLNYKLEWFKSISGIAFHDKDYNAYSNYIKNVVWKKIKDPSHQFTYIRFLHDSKTLNFRFLKLKQTDNYYSLDKEYIKFDTNEFELVEIEYKNI